MPWTDPTCQVIASGSLSPAWTVISRHGEYAQSETECNIPNAVSVAGSNLTITTSASASTCGDFNADGTVRTTPTSWPYSTGDVQWSTFSFTYGTIVFRVQTPSVNTDLWPALWLLGSNCQNSNKYSGDTGFDGCPNIGDFGYHEIDMLECYNSGGWCQFHVANPGFAIGGGCDATFTVDTSYHTYRVLWAPSSIQLYVDDSLLTTCNQSIAFPMFLIAQTQTGGSSGTPANTYLPATFSIDFVKVCSSTTGCANGDTNARGIDTMFYDDFTGV